MWTKDEKRKNPLLWDVEIRLRKVSEDPFLAPVFVGLARRFPTKTERSFFRAFPFALARRALGTGHWALGTMEKKRKVSC